MASGRYSIRDLEQITGIKAHTLRIWEQRYGLLDPLRTDTNIRYYNDNHLQFILNVSVLNKSGMKISRIAELAPAQVMDEVRKLTTTTEDPLGQLSALVLCMLHLDEDMFDHVFDNYSNNNGFEQAITGLLYPFLDHIGNLWLTGAIRPSHEHFITNLIRQKIIAAIDRLPERSILNAKQFLLFTPEKETHEISLLFSQYMLRTRGFKTFYLGINTPYDDLQSITQDIDPDYLMTIVTTNPAGDLLLQLVNKLITDFPAQQIILSGLQVKLSSKEMPVGILTFDNPTHFISFLNDLTGININ